MTGINRVIIENFQSHENTVIELDEGLNVIVGPSDQGKSAVLRAIKWVLYNEPRGIEFIRNGKSSAKVTLEFTNGYKVVRERSKSRNRYEVIDPEGATTVYEGFGNNIPEEVVKIHGIQKVVLDSDISSSINIGEQLEGPFLLSETPSIRAKALGRLTGIHIIDRASRDTNTDQRREVQSSERIKNDLEDANRRLEEFERLRQIESILEESEEIINTVNYHAKKYEILENKRSTLKLLELEVGRSQEALKSTEKISECGIVLENLMILYRRLDKLQRSQKNLQTIEPEVSKCEDIIQKTGDLNNMELFINHAGKSAKMFNGIMMIKEKLMAVLKEIEKAELFLEKGKSIYDAETVYSGILSKTEKLVKITELYDSYKSIDASVNEGKRYLNENSDELNRLSKAFGEYLKKVGKCPICSSEINEAKAEEILRHYCEHGG